VAALSIVIALCLAPLLPGIVNRVKAVVAGRRGQPLLQSWFDVVKLLSKGAVYSRTTTWAFRAGPVAGLAAVLTALLVVPFAGRPGLLAFDGDLILLAGLFALMRFVTIVSALDTGSAFEGMGASREAQWAVLTEPAFLLSLASLARLSGSLSLSGMAETLSARTVAQGGLGLLLSVAAMSLVYLAENARIPFDDPNTHLELTMIHEVMVLDHGGPDLGMIVYGSTLKLWVLGSLIVGMLVPRTGLWPADLAISAGGMLLLAIVTGLVESVGTRVRLVRIPQLLVAACIMAALALILVLVG
jgi:formate hydrogenlyase subunit 4